MKKQSSKDRKVLVKLAHGLLNDSEIDAWAKKLEAAHGDRHRKGRIVAREFLPVVCDRLRASSNRLHKIIGARNPSAN